MPSEWWNNFRRLPEFWESPSYHHRPFASQDHCSHSIQFDYEKAKHMSSEEVRKNYPRQAGLCPLGCGYNGVSYASYEHYLAGDW